MITSAQMIKKQATGIRFVITVKKWEKGGSGWQMAELIRMYLMASCIDEGSQVANLEIVIGGDLDRFISIKEPRAGLMYCHHCECWSDDMPGWKHEVLPDRLGTVEHLWTLDAPKPTLSISRFVVSAIRNPLVDPHFNGTAMMTWKLQRADGSVLMEGMCTSIDGGATRLYRLGTGR